MTKGSPTSEIGAPSPASAAAALTAISGPMPLGSPIASATGSALPVALAIGDPNGIGPEIAVKAAAALAGEGAPISLVGDPFVIDAYAARFANGVALT